MPSHTRIHSLIYSQRHELRVQYIHTKQVDILRRELDRARGVRAL